jgi:hypothetical protein
MPADPLRKAPKLRASRYTKNILVHVIGVARLVEKALIAKTHEMVRVDRLDERRHRRHPIGDGRDGTSRRGGSVFQSEAAGPGRET